MMRKVRVVKYGQKPAMSKPGYSRGFNSGQFPVYYPGTEWTAPSTQVNKGLQPVPWDEANVEAEGGETAYVPDQGGLPAHFNINGPRHSEGGVPLNLPPDTFIYSDTSKMKFNGPILDYFGKNGSKKGKGKKSYTPADLAKQYDINKYRKILQNPDSDDIQRHSAELMIQNYNKKLGALALAQEAKKGFPDGIPVAAMPYLMSYAIEPEMVLPTMPEQQQQMPMGQMPMQRYGGVPKAQAGMAGAQNMPNLQEINDWNSYLKNWNDYRTQQGLTDEQIDTGKYSSDYFEDYKKRNPSFGYSREQFVPKMQGYFNAIKANPYASEVYGVQKFDQTGKDLSKTDAWVGSRTSQYYAPVKGSNFQSYGTEGNLKGSADTRYVINPYAKSKEDVWTPVTKTQVGSPFGSPTASVAPAASKELGGTWAAPNYYQVGGSYSAQTEPEYGGNWMGQARSRKQMGGSQEEEQLIQIIQMYAQMSGQDPDEIVAQLQQMEPDQAQQTLEQMAQQVQQTQSQSMGMQAPAYAYGGTYLPKAQFGHGEPGIKGLKRYTESYKDVTNIDDLVAAYNRLNQANENTEWYSFGWFPESESNQIKNMQLEIAKRIHNVALTSQNSDQRRKAADALHNMKTSWYSWGWVPGSDEFGIGMRALSADIATIKAKEAEDNKRAAFLVKNALPAYETAYQEAMYNPDAFSAEDAQTITNTWKNLKLLESELQPRGGYKLGTGLYLNQLSNIPLTPPRTPNAPIVSKPKTVKKGTIPFTPADSAAKAVNSIVYPNVPKATAEESDSLINLDSKQTGGSKFDFSDYMRKRFKEGKIATGAITPMNENDPAFVIPLMATAGPAAANLLYNLYKFGQAGDKFKQLPEKTSGAPKLVETKTQQTPATTRVPGANKNQQAPGAAKVSGAQRQKPVNEFDLRDVVDPILVGASTTAKQYKPWIDMAPYARGEFVPSVWDTDFYKKYTSLPGFKSLFPEQEQSQIPYAPPAQDSIPVAARPDTTQQPMGNPNSVIKLGDRFFKLDSLGQPWREVDSTVYQSWTNKNQAPGYNVEGQDTFTIVPQGTINTDSLVEAELKALGVGNKRFGGGIRKYQPGGTVVEANGKYYLRKDGKDYEISEEQANRLNEARATASTTPTTGSAAKPAGSSKKTGSKSKEYDPSQVPAEVRKIMDEAGIAEDPSVMNTGVISTQTWDPKKKAWVDEKSGLSVSHDAWKKNWEKIYLEDRKKRGLPDFDYEGTKDAKGRSKDVADFEDFYNKHTYNSIYEELKKRGRSDDDAKKVADYFVSKVGFLPPVAGKRGLQDADQIQGNFHNSRTPFKFVEKEKPAEPAKEKGPIQAAPQAQYAYDYGYAPWWAQDVVNIAGSAGDFLRLKKYLPWAPKVEPVVPDPTFYDPTRALAQNAEQMAIGTQGAAAFAGPQQFSARVSGLQGKAGENAANIVGQYSNMNVGEANRFAGQRAGIYNQANQVNARASQDMYDKTTVANQNYDNAKLKARRELRQNYIQGLTNKAQAQAMNTMYPDYFVDPSTGGYVFYKPGARTMEPSSADTDSSYWDFIKKAREDYKMDPEEASKAYRSMYSSDNTRGSRRRRGSSQDDFADFGYPGFGYPGYRMF